ncbi:hypothetical protein [Xanthomonas cannabis]|uniref:hypothetical protein n=1 Tax=Xanthomonas cannabis TaxID=1885674 RepID=UPI0033B1FF71
MTIEFLFYTQLASIITYVAAAFWLYRTLVAQKDAVIELLKNRNELLEKRVAELEKQTPDSLVESLSKRVGIAKSEIESLNQDREKHRTEIEHKESELEGLGDKLNKLQDLLKDSDLVCPECEAPLIRRGSFPISGEINGREVEADISYAEYECGYSVSDDRAVPVSPCQANRGEP